jgi:hypothetical protein
MSPLGTSNSIDLKRLNELRHKYELIFDWGWGLPNLPNK